MTTDLAGARSRLETAGGAVEFHRLGWLEEQEIGDLSKLPHTVKILVENLLRRAGSRDVADDDVRALAGWPDSVRNIAFMPGRVLMQDFTGVPAVVDLAAMRSAVTRAGGDPTRVNPLVPVDLIIDHSVQVDLFRTKEAYEANIEWEYRRNAERYTLLRWARQAFEGLRVVPPGAGICHQVNLEHLGEVVTVRGGLAFPDTLVGTDSHTTMINGLGVLGWGVGGIEAEAAMLGQPMFLPQPVVVGVRVIGALPPGTTATDLVLTLTQMLREHGVVEKFVEFFGAGLSTLGLADRATLSNMCPEYGATSAYFPVDAETLRYLSFTARADRVDLVERYAKEQRLFRTDADPEPVFNEVVDLDLSSVEPSLAGPKRPQDRVPLGGVWPSFVEAFRDRLVPDPRPAEVGRFEDEGGNPDVAVDPQAAVEPGAEQPVTLPGNGVVRHGSVVIAAITSCTNTSNPSVMVAAGLLAKKAIEAGLEAKPWVKTSLAPGSRVVTDYLDRAGLTPYLEKLGFGLVGYGCTTCIGNSGPLPDDVAAAVQEEDLAVVAVLSGNRNFEGRIHPQVRASYLASPPLCVAYALAGHVDLDLSSDALGHRPDGTAVSLADIWPSAEEVSEAIAVSSSPDQFSHEYARIWDGDDLWNNLPTPTGPDYAWDPASTYAQEPPFFTDLALEPPPVGDVEGARVLVMVGDSITTDHISPAGSIKRDSPAGAYLSEHGVQPADFNSYGARRGNHEVMLRGTFANIRLRNALAPGTEGSWTTHVPTGDVVSVFEAAERYRAEGVPLAVIAGKEYGSGSSRDWAAKGPALLGVRFVLAESFERIHRSNLVGMGVLPVQFADGDSASSLGLTGRETFAVRGIAGGITPGQDVTVTATADDGTQKAFTAKVRIDGAAEVEYFRHGGILPMVLREMLRL
ncbi:MAG TPA: aconitate hydratase AcnA [Actinomycetota bacterium]|jgi:aconitate hydratase|nr:aconitate hydratase AcnA [Actinomycetota bacterium]